MTASVAVGERSVGKKWPCAATYVPPKNVPVARRIETAMHEWGNQPLDGLLMGPVPKPGARVGRNPSRHRRCDKSRKSLGPRLVAVFPLGQTLRRILQHHRPADKGVLCEARKPLSQVQRQAPHFPGRDRREPHQQGHSDLRTAQANSIKSRSTPRSTGPTAAAWFAFVCAPSNRPGLANSRDFSRTSPELGRRSSAPASPGLAFRDTSRRSAARRSRAWRPRSEN